MGTREGRSKWAGKQMFTTGEAAEICRVSQQTIIRCFDKGRLQGFRVPGSRFRKIPRQELIRFMKANQISTEPLEPPTRRVLVIDDDEALVELVRKTLDADGRFEVKSAATGYDAGLLTQQFKPHLLLLDDALPDVSGTLVCQRIRANPDLQDTKILIVSSTVDGIDLEKLAVNGADGFVRKPVQSKKLLNQIRTVLQIG
ncbi:MAG: response regulator [Planctomycetota bacterium]|jgi:excisionase family DNA binding protein